MCVTSKKYYTGQLENCTLYLRLVIIIDVAVPAALLQYWAIAGIMSAILSYHRWIDIYP